MKTCALCHEEVTSQMIRRGSVISRGSEIYHRECRRGSKPAPEIVDEERLAESGEGFEADLDLSTETEEPAFGPIMVVKYASAGRRIAAHVIDGIILNIIVAIPSFVAGIIIGRFAAEGAALIATIVGWAIGLTIPLVYALWFWTKKAGATPGKMALGIRIVSADNGPLSGEQSFIRFLGYIPSGLVLGLGYLAMLWDGEKRCWHDRMAGTRVIRV
jgi:uncharacterized RDD family membrane protein YckC